jgi:hypothetical protein
LPIRGSLKNAISTLDVSINEVKGIGAKISSLENEIQSIQNELINAEQAIKNSRRPTGYFSYSGTIGKRLGFENLGSEYKYRSYTKYAVISGEDPGGAVLFTYETQFDQPQYFTMNVVLSGKAPYTDEYGFTKTFNIYVEVSEAIINEYQRNIERRDSIENMQSRLIRQISISKQDEIEKLTTAKSVALEACKAFFTFLTNPNNPMLLKIKKLELPHIKIADTVVTTVVLSTENRTIQQALPEDEGINPVDIEGNWNNDLAIQIALRRLQNNDWNISGLNNPLEHILIREFNLVFKNNDCMLLAFSSIKKGDDCHGCAPYLSLFEFTKKTNGWKLNISDMGFTNGGSWGTFPPEWINVLAIGNNKYAISITNGFSGQGYGSMVLSIFTLVGEKFNDILNITTSMSSPEKSWDSKTTILNTATADFYDIEFVRTGDLNLLLEGGNDTNIANKDGKVRARDIFEFDGKKYMRVTSND